MEIDTREELINALHEASELEHALLVQYLYAGMSFKKSLSEGLTERQQSMARKWQGEILQIAREEMGHLAIVCNLLSAIGAPSKFDRPSMPRKIGLYPFAFDLLPFGEEALKKFMIFELPRGVEPPFSNLDLESNNETLFEAAAPEPLNYDLVGELYEKIAEGFKNIDERSLFIGPVEAQTKNGVWSDRSLDVKVVTDKKSALEAINEIVIDGEGSTSNDPTAHYNRFKKIWEEYKTEGSFAASRNLAKNPVTRLDATISGNVTLIENEEAFFLAELFNSSYGVMLLLLQQYFSMAPSVSDISSQRRRRALQEASQRIMSVAIRPVAEQLTLTPLYHDNTLLMAGPPFELYTDVTLSPYTNARWEILLERFALLYADYISYSGTFKARINEIGESIRIMSKDLETTFKETE